MLEPVVLVLDIVDVVLDPVVLVSEDVDAVLELLMLYSLLKSLSSCSLSCSFSSSVVLS